MDSAVAILSRAAPGSALVMLVTFAVLAVWRGWLVPRVTVDAIRETLEGRAADALAREAEWRAAYNTSEQARRVQDEGLADIIEGMRTVEALVRALPAPPARRGDPP